MQNNYGIPILTPRFKVINEGKPFWMFSLACKLVKMDAYSYDFQKVFLAKNPCDCHIRLNQIVASVNTMNGSFPFLIGQISKITTKDTS